MSFRLRTPTSLQSRAHLWRLSTYGTTTGAAGRFATELATRLDTAFRGRKVDLGRQFFMEPIIVARITGVVTLVGVIPSNSKRGAVMEVKPDTPTAKVEMASTRRPSKRRFRVTGAPLSYAVNLGKRDETAES